MKKEEVNELDSLGKSGRSFESYFLRGTFIALGLASIAYTYSSIRLIYIHQKDYKEYYFENINKTRELPLVKDLNNDGLSDLVYSDNEIYLQSNDGKFMSRNCMFEQEKAKFDSLYKLKRDSLLDSMKQTYDFAKEEVGGK